MIFLAIRTSTQPIGAVLNGWFRMLSDALLCNKIGFLHGVKQQFFFYRAIFFNLTIIKMQCLIHGVPIFTIKSMKSFIPITCLV